METNVHHDRRTVSWLRRLLAMFGSSLMPNW
jgi:hypothetical protein